MLPQERFGKNVKAAREAQGLTQQELGARIGHMEASEVSRLENGGRDPQLETIVRIARGLDVAPSRLLDDIA